MLPAAVTTVEGNKCSRVDKRTGYPMQKPILVMVALCNRADHYIFMLFLLSSFFFFYFLAKSQRSEIGCLPYFYTWRGLSTI